MRFGSGSVGFGGGGNRADDYFKAGLRQSAQRPWRVLYGIACSGRLDLRDRGYLPRPKETVGNFYHSFGRELDFVLFYYNIG